MAPWTLALGGLAAAAGAPLPRSTATLLASLPPLEDRSGRGPAIAPSWTSQVVQSSGASVMGGTKGTFKYDTANKRWRVTGCSTIKMFHEAGDEMCEDQLAMDTHKASPLEINMTMGTGQHATCKVEPMPYYDLFGIMVLGEKTGTSVVGGVPCDMWSAHYESALQNVSASACVAADGVPRLFNMSTGMAYKAASQITYLFSEPQIGPVPAEAFAPTESCRDHYPAPPCPSSGTQELSVYRIHGKNEPLSLENRNVGDGLGDMGFFCAVVGMDPTQVVTLWSVSADSSWGQYAFCLYTQGKNKCWGHTANKVGRESSLGVGDEPFGNQCSKNEEYGSWYSFPDNGHCAEGKPVGTDGCTWTAKPVRSVLAGCIIEERGLLKMCAQEVGHAPMLKSAAIFAAALASADPAKGGCPDAQLDTIVV